MGMVAFYAGLILGVLLGIVGLTLYSLTLGDREEGKLGGPLEGFTQIPQNQSKP